MELSKKDPRRGFVFTIANNLGFNSFMIWLVNGNFQQENTKNTVYF